MDHSLSFHKTRIAPTPSGFLHLGNILSFSLTATLAYKANAAVLLRIDDLDRDRAQPAYVQDIFDTLRFLDIPWQEGPLDATGFGQAHSQVHRMPLYQQALDELAARQAVFACTCSRAQVYQNNPEGIYPGTCRNKHIPLHTANASWRLFTDPTRQLPVKDAGGQPSHAALPAHLTDFVVKKKDGFPAYQLTSLLDDLHYGVDLIVRGADLWPSTLAQQTLAQVLGKTAFQDIRFLHHPLLLNPDGQKLSKSTGATSVQYLRREGRPAAAIYTMAAALAGIHTPVHNWQMLGEALMGQGWT